MKNKTVKDMVINKIIYDLFDHRGSHSIAVKTVNRRSEIYDSDGEYHGSTTRADKNPESRFSEIKDALSILTDEELMIAYNKIMRIK